MEPHFGQFVNEHQDPAAEVDIDTPFVEASVVVGPTHAADLDYVDESVPVTYTTMLLTVHHWHWRLRMVLATGLHISGRKGCNRITLAWSFHCVYEVLRPSSLILLF